MPWRKTCRGFRESFIPEWLGVSSEGWGFLSHGGTPKWRVGLKKHGKSEQKMDDGWGSHISGNHLSWSFHVFACFKKTLDDTRGILLAKWLRFVVLLADDYLMIFFLTQSGGERTRNEFTSLKFKTIGMEGTKTSKVLQIDGVPGYESPRMVSNGVCFGGFHVLNLHIPIRYQWIKIADPNQV